MPITPMRRKQRQLAHRLSVVRVNRRWYVKTEGHVTECATIDEVAERIADFMTFIEAECKCRHH